MWEALDQKYNIKVTVNNGTLLINSSSTPSQTLENENDEKLSDSVLVQSA